MSATMLLTLLFACTPKAAKTDSLAQVCEPLRCEDAGLTCGPLSDGCGAELDCGACEAPALCTEEGACEVPCTPLEAMFFDLGGTLVLEGEDGLFAENPGAFAMLQAFQDRGLPLGIISTVPADWDLDDVRALLVDPSILDRFDVILLSSQAQARPKPDPEIYVEALAMLPTPPPIERVAFLTEELRDIANAEPPTRGARAAGMIGVHLSDAPPDALADHTVPTTGLATIPDAAWVACIEAE